MSIISRLVSMSRRNKRLVALTHDAVIAVVSVLAAFVMRLDSWAGPHGSQWIIVAFAPVVSIPIFLRFDCYRAIFRFVGGGTISKIARGSVVYGVICFLIFTVYSIPGILRSLGILQPILLFMMIVSSRIAVREVLRYGHVNIDAPNAKNVLIYGAGLSGRQVAAGFGIRGGHINIVGMIDDDPRLHGNLIDDHRVYGSQNLPMLLQELAVDEILLAIPSASRTRRNQILEAVRGSGAHIRILPDLTDLASGRVTVSELRELSVEDLLGRDPVPPIVELFERCVRDKVVMVTGAGGSIGSELCRQILTISPKKIVLLEASEYALYAIERELQALLKQRPGGAV